MLMYKIGELSRLCCLPVKTLRYYDQQGLLKPDHIDPFTGYRYYSPARLADCHRIIALKELGFSLEEIGRYLRGSGEEIVSLLSARRQALEAEIAHARSQLSRLDAVKNRICEGEKPMFAVIFRQSDPIRCAAERRIFPTREEADAALARLWKAIPAQSRGKRTVVINYETDYRESDFDLAVCVEITARVQGMAELSAVSGECAALVCRRGQLDEGYAALIQAVHEKNAQIIGPFAEIAHEDGTMELIVPVCRLRDAAEESEDSPAEGFADDPDAIGAWEIVDILPSRQQFFPGSRKYTNWENVWLKKLYFLPGGKGYWIVDSWTKGEFRTVCNYPSYTYRHRYCIEDDYMFVEMQERRYASRGGRPLIYVYRRLDRHAYTGEELRRRDDVHLPFVPDERMVGRWESCGLVHEMADFDPERQKPAEELFLRRLELGADGSGEQQTAEHSHGIAWTRGYILHHAAGVAAGCEIRRLDGEEYLFYQWKSGDYQYGGRTPLYYVLKRKKETKIPSAP